MRPLRRALPAAQVPRDHIPGVHEVHGVSRVSHMRAGGSAYFGTPCKRDAPCCARPCVPGTINCSSPRHDGRCSYIPRAQLWREQRPRARAHRRAAASAGVHRHLLHLDALLHRPRLLHVALVRARDVGRMGKARASRRRVREQRARACDSRVRARARPTAARATSASTSSVCSRCYYPSSSSSPRSSQVRGGARRRRLDRRGLPGAM